MDDGDDGDDGDDCDDGDGDDAVVMQMGEARPKTKKRKLRSKVRMRMNFVKTGQIRSVCWHHTAAGWCKLKGLSFVTLE